MTSECVPARIALQAVPREACSGSLDGTNEAPGDGVKLGHRLRTPVLAWSNDRTVERPIDRARLTSGRQTAGEVTQYLPRRLGVGAHDLENRRGLDRLALAPAVVVGNHPEQRVGQLGLAREPRLGHRGHADHVAAPLAVERALGPCRELQPLDRDVAATAM